MNLLRWTFERFGMPPEVDPDEGRAIVRSLVDSWLPRENEDTPTIERAT